MENKLKEVLQKQAWCKPASSDISDSFRSFLGQNSFRFQLHCYSSLLLNTQLLQGSSPRAQTAKENKVHI